MVSKLGFQKATEYDILETTFNENHEEKRIMNQTQKMILIRNKKSVNRNPQRRRKNERDTIIPLASNISFSTLEIKYILLIVFLSHIHRFLRN